jgi:hypothetical protein
MVTAVRTPPAGFEELWSKFPWPDTPPYPDVPVVGRDSAGFALLASALASRVDPVVMEIGAEFGGSTRKFIELGANVVSVDPWPDSYRVSSFPEVQPLLGQERAVYNLFLSFCWSHRDRLATVRAPSPEGPLIVRDAGVPIDLVYIDGDHRYDAALRDLTIADALFPSAILAGDDWLLRSDAKKYEQMGTPVRLAVQSWAAFNDVHVEVSGNTWLLDRERPYNLKPPPRRFSSGGEAWAAVDKRLKRIEHAVQANQRPTLALAAARRARTTVRSGLGALRARRQARQEDPRAQFKGYEHPS